jgi:Flp pilus assembly protein TadG
VRAFRRAGEEGSAVIELALILPVFLGILMGLLVFGLYFNTYLSLTQAVGSGAQYLQQIRQSTTNPCQDTYNALIQAAPNLNSSLIGFSLNLNGTPENSTSCSGAQTLLVSNSPATVTATYPCSLVIMGVNYATSGACPLTVSVTEFEY